MLSIRLKKRYIVLIILLLLFAFLSYRYFTYQPAPHYQTVTVSRQNLVRSVLATGQLDALSKVSVGAQVSGQLKHLYVDVGSQVTKGQRLAQIDPETAENSIKAAKATLQQLQAQLHQAQAQYQLASITLLRQQNLARLQAVSKQELDQANTDALVKKAQISNIRAQIVQSQATLDDAETNLGYTNIVAPMAGEVTQVTTLQGQTVIAAQQAPEILILADLSTMLVKAQVSEADVVQLKAGQKAWFTILGAPNQRFYGVVKDIQPTPSKINNAIFYEARIEVPNKQRLLRLQMTAQVHIELAEVKDALTVPLAALGAQMGPNKYQVAVLDSHQQAQQREITVGERNDIAIEVKSGLKAGDKVIIGSSTDGSAA